jgi:hypothetical protein
MSVLSFDPAAHGGVSTVGAAPTRSWSRARNTLNAANAFNDGANRAASRRTAQSAMRNVLNPQNEPPPPFAIPIPASGDVTPAVDGPIVAIVNTESEKQPTPRGRTLQRSKSSPSPSPSPSRSPSRLRRALSTGGAGAGFFASRGGEDGRQQQNSAPEFDDSDAGSAHATNECTKKAGSVASKIAQGNESLYEIIGDMQKRIATHKEISERVRAMKEELERLREAANNLPQPTTPDGIAQKALATAAIESCTANMSGMESAVDELVSTIRRLKQQIIEIGATDYDITDTLGITSSAA